MRDWTREKHDAESGQGPLPLPIREMIPLVGLDRAGELWDLYEEGD